MANHCRTQIRQAITAGLAGVTTAATVSAARLSPLPVDDLPALLIFTPSESAEDMNKDADQTRGLTLTVEGHRQEDSGPALADGLDAMAAEAEPLVFSSMPAWVKEVELISTEIELTGEAVRPAGLIRLEFMVTYHVNPAAPDTPL
jgi:hypothetical protein